MFEFFCLKCFNKPPSVLYRKLGSSCFHSDINHVMWFVRMDHRHWGVAPPWPLKIYLTISLIVVAIAKIESFLVSWHAGKVNSKVGSALQLKD